MSKAMKLAAGLVVAAALAGLPQQAAAQASKKGAAPATPANCVDKGGKGWGSSTEDARFQAWEAVLQATSWGMWSAWITGGAKVGTAAAGYKVSNVREKCSSEGSQKVCIMRAKLCN